jgi:hypothetical protein
VNIEWTALVAIAVVAAAAALTVVLLLSLARVAWSAGSAGRVRGQDDDGTASGTRSVARTATAVLCVCAAALIVCYGLYLIVAE